jgi:hypothetical protein
MRDLTHDLATPALSALLGKGDLTRARNPWLIDAFSLKERPAAAPLRVLAAEAADTAHAATSDNVSNHRWVCLDPVNLAFVERSIRVGDPASLRLTVPEAQSLGESLAPIFAQVGELTVSTPDVWHLRVHPNAPPLPEFAALPDFIGGRAEHCVPTDRLWSQMLNDAQQSLHEHPVNLARAANGQLPVNSLWPWGGGTLPHEFGCSHDQVLGGDLILQGLARLCGMGAMQVPTEWQPSHSNRPLTVLSDLVLPRHQGDGLRWRELLATLDAQWFAPVLTALRRGHLARFTLVAPSDEGDLVLRLSRASLLKFWRSSKPLTTMTC